MEHAVEYGIHRKHEHTHAAALHNHIIKYVFFGEEDSWCCFMQLLESHLLLYRAEHKRRE